MLRIYQVVLQVLKQLQPALRQIELRDRDLARQLRRCSSSVALNLAEGMYSRGKNRAARYHSALGSVRETLACLEVAVVCSYIQQDANLHDQLDRIVGTSSSWSAAKRASLLQRGRGSRPQPRVASATASAAPEFSAK